jgi:hypothetical protein
MHAVCLSGSSRSVRLPSLHNVICLDDVEAARTAYVGLAITEIATFRGELFGRQVG